MKKCTKCGIEKPQDQYYSRGNMCKTCHRKMALKRYNENKDQLNSERRTDRAREAEKENQRKRRARNLALKVKIESVERQIKAQDGKTHKQLLEAARLFHNGQENRKDWFSPDWFKQAQGA